MKYKLVIDKENINGDMLCNIIDSSCGVIQKMLRAEDIAWNSNKGKKDTWFVSWTADTEKDKSWIYEEFMQALCRYSVKRKLRHSQEYTPKWGITNNEKAYAYDLFKRLGMFGEKYRAARLELMRPLNGSSAGVSRNKVFHEAAENASGGAAE
jgi:hypothetical protein